LPNEQYSHDELVIYLLSKHNVYQAVPLDGTISYSDLASKTAFSEPQVRRFVRHAISNGVFTERDGQVAHNAFSAAVVRNPLNKSWIEAVWEDISPSIVRFPEAIEKYGDSQEPHESGLGVVVGLQKGESFLSTYLHTYNGGKTSDGKLRGVRFGEAMRAMSAGGQHKVSHIHQGFDWDSLGEATIVDVS
jgi:DNA-binding Lrp family transcriptional regulator